MKNIDMELRKFVVPEIIIGEGASLLVGKYLEHFGSRKPMIVTDIQVRQQEWFELIVDKIRECVDDFVIFDDVTPNPKDFEAMIGSELFLAEECDLLIAIGGGSPMDCAKCISIVSTNGGHILDYEGVDQIALPGPPLICIPTTAGTAADVSQFAIINDTNLNIKKTIISKKVVPDLALLDPVPLTTMSPYLTASTGMDVLTHAIEAYVSNASSSLTNLHALEGIRLVSQNLEAAVKEGRSTSTLYQMMVASTQAGFAFSNASLGAVHAMAHSLGGLLDLPHGECNSILLEHVIAMNFDTIPEKFTVVAKNLDVNIEGASQDEIKKLLINRIASLRSSVGIAGVISVEPISTMQFNALVAATLEDPCMITNPRVLSAKEVGEIFEKIISNR